MKSKILLSLLIVVVLIQLIRPMPNLSDDNSKSIATAYVVPDNIQKMIQRACADCHSNNTNYPWYSKIQPVAWWLNHHIEEGKAELNFSTFATYSLKKQAHKLHEVVEMIEENEMPLSSYTLIHKEAILNEVGKNELKNWAAGLEQKIKSTQQISMN